MAPSLSTAMLSSPNTGLQNPMSSVGVGQPSAPTINTSAPIDPSSMQRAYEALGLPYSSQATGQAQARGAPGGPGQTAGAQNAQTQQQQLPQQMRPINALGKANGLILSLYVVWALLETLRYWVVRFLHVCIDWLDWLLNGSKKWCNKNPTIFRYNRVWNR